MRFKSLYVDSTAIEKCVLEQKGEHGTLHWRMFFKSSFLQSSSNRDTNTVDDGLISCWHDIPVVTENARNFNYVNEIPKGGVAKFECASKERWNPIKQAVQNGKLRYFPYGAIPFNYGFFPQTWSDPAKKSEFSDVETFGDNEPLDVVELSNTPLACGQISPVKVLGLIGLIDDGEMDWKVLALATAHESSAKISTLDDVDNFLGDGCLTSVRNWFDTFKTEDGKPNNYFAHGGAFLGTDMALNVIDECHKHWKDLVSGRVETTIDITSNNATYLAEHGSDDITMNRILAENVARGAPKVR